MGLAENPDRLTHSLLWDGVACTWIPKVACTTIRYSFCVAAGLVDESEVPLEVSEYIEALRPTRHEMVTARYRFALVRQPVRRLVSCFLDRVVVGDLRKLDFDPDRFTMADFIEWAAAEGSLNHHTREQARFLNWNYHDVFRVEDPRWSRLVEERSGLRIVNRSWPHHLGEFDRVVGDFSGATVTALRELRERGCVPTAASMTTRAMRKRIRSIYSRDVALYSSIA